MHGRGAVSAFSLLHVTPGPRSLYAIGLSRVCVWFYAVETPIGRSALLQLSSLELMAPMVFATGSQ
jgi:hypothetical protein